MFSSMACYLDCVYCLHFCAFETWSVPVMVTSMTCYLGCSIDGYFNDLLPGVFNQWLLQ